MMSHAHASSTSCLQMSIPSLSSYSSTSCTPQTTLPINKSPEHPQNEACCPVANTTSSTHKETDLIFPIYNIHLGFISSHFFEAVVKQRMGLCQELPLKAHLQSCRDHLITQFVWYLLEFIFSRFRASQSSLPYWSHY